MAPKKGKKGKKGKKEKKDPNALSNVNRVFCELTITDLNKKLARLRTTISGLEEHNVTLKEEMRELTYDRKDVAAYLTRTLDQRNAEYETLEEEHLKLIKIRETETAMFENKIKDMEAKYKAMNTQLTSEIKLITSKLHSLDEFRLERDELYARFEETADARLEEEKLKQEALVEIEQRGIVETNMLKKDIALKLLNVAEDFTRSNEIRHAGYTRRLIRENIALQKEIDQMVIEQIKMNQDFNEYVFRNKEIVQNYTALENTNKDLMLKGQMQISIIETLTQTCEKLKANYTEVLKYRDAYQKLANVDDCKKFNYKQVSKKLRALGQRIQMFKLERSKMAAQIEQQSTEISNLRSVICKLKNSIELVIGARKEESIGSDYSYYMDEGVEEQLDDDRSYERRQHRQNLLSELLVIVNSCKMPEKSEISSAKRSTSSIYHPGKIGFVLGVPKETLVDIMFDAAQKPASSTRSSRTTEHVDLHADGLKIPDACAAVGNQLLDIEIGSDFFVSSSRDDKKGAAVEEEEPLEFGDEGEDSSSDVVPQVTSSSSEKPNVQAATKKDDKQQIHDVVDQLSGEEGESDEEEEETAAADEYDEEDEAMFFF